MRIYFELQGLIIPQYFQHFTQVKSREICIAIDIAMAMSGSEAVVESYYSVMKS